MLKTKSEDILLVNLPREEVGHHDVEAALRTAQSEGRRSAGDNHQKLRDGGVEFLKEGVLHRDSNSSSRRRIPWRPPRRASQGILPRRIATASTMSLRPSADVILRHELAYILVLGGMAVGCARRIGLACST